MASLQHPLTYLAPLVWLGGLLTGPSVLLSQVAGPAFHCGTERWPVKILADSHRALLQTEPIASTVADLGAIPIPEIPYPQVRRIAPQEITVYRVRARLQEAFMESDHDLHLILDDLAKPDYSMIAEIPDSACALGTGRESAFAAARRVLRQAPRGAVLEIEGVGFFDFIHNQRGRAMNGIELHPVLVVRVVSDTLK
jgi:hypothetical protein